MQNINSVKSLKKNDLEKVGQGDEKYEKYEVGQGVVKI
jgi:hypothetical protein